MGLAVSQVRLLALTSRKADIELQMQVDSKRKQMLTRKSTELSQTYYNKLQDSNIKYATSNGFEDVNYSFLMGETQNKKYTNEFLKQVRCASSTKNIAQKSENGMILTNQYGQVVVNNQMGAIIAKVNEANSGATVPEKVANAVFELIYQCSGLKDPTNNVFSDMKRFFTSTSGSSVDVDYTKRAKFINVMEEMAKNGGFMNGGTYYIHAGIENKFYKTPEDAKDQVNWIAAPFKVGYVYNICNQDGSSAVIGAGAAANGYLCVDTVGTLADMFDTDYDKTSCEYIGNLIAYFAPIISAAVQNGTSASNDIVKTPKAGGEYLGAKQTGDPTTLAEQAMAELSGKPIGSMIYFKNDDGIALGYFIKTDASSDPIKSVTREEFFDSINYSVSENGNGIYDTASNTEKLQAGFKSGVFQLAMVSDPSKGIYHKNTSMTYFTHMNYVVDKMDTSKKEEITAWFNKEQAAISEQETYWDAEIQNLSTELNSVTQEIESVKQLKSNSVKSVFNWANG